MHNYQTASKTQKDVVSYQLLTLEFKFKKVGKVKSRIEACYSELVL